MTFTPGDSSGRLLHEESDFEPRTSAIPASDHATPRSLGGRDSSPSGAEPAVDLGTAHAYSRRWSLWRQPRRQVAYILGFELVAVIWAIFEIWRMAAPAGVDWIRFGILSACGLFHSQLTRRQEDRRRSHTPTVHIDLTTIWSFPAVLLLPVPLALLVIVAIRAHRWLVGRRPLYKFAFSTASIALAAMSTQLVLELIHPDAWDYLGTAKAMSSFAAFAVAGGVYVLVQALLVGGALALGSAAPTMRSVFGSRDDNLLDIATVALGIVTALVAVSMPPALVIMLAVSVLGNRIAEIQQLRADARTDPKTGLLNVTGWREAARRELARGQRLSGRFTLLMIDLDHFKAINDTWGHPAGDDVLQMVARVLSQSMRPADIVARFGGEEFLALLPDTDGEQAYRAAERIRRTVMELQVVTTDKRNHRTTIRDQTTSIGLATYPQDGTSIDALLQAADSALYKAKEGGRNRVRLASTP
jgi:diguanylate cyclase (GGDEF)-like protein